MERYIDALLDIIITGTTKETREIVTKGKRIYFTIMGVFLFFFISAVVGGLGIFLWIEGLAITSVSFFGVLILFIIVIIKKIIKKLKKNN